MSVSVIISEVQDEKGSTYQSNSKSVGESYVSPIEEELTQLVKACHPRKPSKNMHPSYSKKMDLLQESALKKPAMEICESVTIKQALRKLCISQASEMAAMKRVSKSIGVAVSSEAGTIKRLYTAVVVHSSQPGKDKHDRLLQISLLPERKNSMSSEKVSVSIGKESCHKDFQSSSKISEATTTAKVMKPKARDVLSSFTPCGKKIQSSSKICDGMTTTMVAKPKIRDVLSSTPCNKKNQTSSNISDAVTTAKVVKPKIRDVLSSTPGESGRKLQICLRFRKDEKKKLDPSSDTIMKNANLSGKSPVSPKTLVKPKVKPTSKNKSCLNKQSNCSEKDVSPVSSGNKPCCKKDLACNKPTVGKEDQHFETKSGSTSNKSKYGEFRTKRRVLFQSKGKGEFSQSSNSSIGDYSTSTSNSGESNQIGSCASVRPHMSNDVRWAAIRHVEVQDGNIGLKNFKLHKRLGCGDIGTVYLAELIGYGCLFALKVMDNEFLISRNKMARVQTETEILQMLDHPFLPTLYTYFTTDNLSCLAMEYCPGGDLHVLRQKQLSRTFSEPAARFYVAEVLLALEYLHMLGVVYRDLKPENILVREDGHIMLSDFDLSLRCGVNTPSLWRSSSAAGMVDSQKGLESYCIGPGFLEPSCAQVSCFTPRLASSMSVTGTAKRGGARLPQLVVEPVEARSNSFVGTHEYLAPEIIKGEDHGSCVDWWTFGIFLYELVFGTTPFKGSDNDETLGNVVSKKLQFPDDPNISFYATDLIRKLLVKDADRRLGSVRGAAEIKQHPFFMGLNWALIRCATPPEVLHPHPNEPPPSLPVPSKYLEFGSNGEGVEFELF